MNTLAKRLTYLIDLLGITQDELAQRAGVSQALIHKLKSGKALESRKISALAKVLNVNADWLATGKGKKERFEENIKQGPDIKGEVPLISWVKAGQFSEAIDNYPVGHGEQMIPVTVPVRAHTFALRVDGDSMEPEFSNGNIIIVEPDMQPEHGHYVIAKNGGDATFKQLVKDGPDWYLKPLNERYPIKPLGDSQIIGVVREKIKVYC